MKKQNDTIILEMQNQLNYSIDIINSMKKLDFSKEITKNSNIDKINKYLKLVEASRDEVANIIFGVLKSTNALLSSSKNS